MSARTFLTGLCFFAATSAGAQITNAEFAQRRDSLAARVSNGVIVALGAPEPAHDFLSFFQEENFLYLTGFREPDAALVIVKKDGKASPTLFVQPKDPAREVWTGNRLGAHGVQAQLGLPGRSYDDFRKTLDSLLDTGLPLYVVGDLGREGAEILSRDAQLVEGIRGRRPRLQVTNLTPVVMRLRGRKSAAELELIRRAVDITVTAQREAMAAAEPGMNEFELQALVEYTFRRNGADRPSFATIIGSGPNSTTLHYNANDRFMNAGETIVMDIGASYRGYAADVTRTIPVSGTFSTEQRAIYQIVRDAHAAAEREAKVGAQAARMSEAAASTLAAGLARLGLIESTTARFDCDLEGARRECPQLMLYYMHGLGHGIGLEVHDPDQYYFTGTIQRGSAFTIEPGVYVRANLLDVLPDTPRNRALIGRLRPAVERYKNIGVRIEDDYIVTDRGVEWISRAPREIAEIERLMQGPYTGPTARDPALVETYRRAVP